MILTIALVAFIHGVASTAAAIDNANSNCCKALLAHPSLTNKIHLPSSPIYSERLAEYYSKNAALAPSCMAMPTSTSDTSEIAKIIHSTGCQFGIRSGGHSAYRGSSSVDAGVTVDFGYMNTTTLSTEQHHQHQRRGGSVTIQVGANWGDVYAHLDGYGVSVAGGRASPVGVGGFVTGGGYSFHANDVGWSCDTVRNFEVVLGNGTVVNANARENADLWRAQKGASGNFGFVTRVEMDIQPTNKIWGGFIVIPPSQTTALFKAYVDFVDNMDKYPHSQALMGFIGSEGPEVQYLVPVSQNLGIANGPEFSGLMSVPDATLGVKDHTYADIAPLVVALTKPGLWTNWIVELHDSNEEMLGFVNERFLQALREMREVAAAAAGDKFGFLVELQPVTESIVKHIAQRGGNVLGLERVVGGGRGPAVMVMMSLSVESLELQTRLMPIALKAHGDVVGFADGRGWNRAWRYAPYAWGGQDPLKDYGEENLRLIREVAGRYDPEGVFQKLRGSGFKIPE